MSKQDTFKSKLKEWLRSSIPGYNLNLIKKDIRYAGKGLEINPSVIIQYPELCFLGNLVNIGASTVISNLGGVVIADRTTIGEQVLLGRTDSSFSDLPIIIGRDCVIENGVQLQPGTIIEDGTVVTQTGMTHSKTTPTQTMNRRFFVVSTGAAGSQSIAQTLSQHKEIHCEHEPNSLLIGLSSAYEYGTVDRCFVKQVLEALYCKIEPSHTLLLGESDQKLGNLIPIIAELLPEARFIWIKRHAHRFVESATFKKHWYNEPEKIPFLLGQLWAKYRLDGSQNGVFAAEVWRQMEPLEKNAWFWQYWNTMIEAHLTQLPAERWLSVELETLSDALADIALFLEVPPTSFELIKTNVGPKNSEGVRYLKENLHKINLYCSEGLSKWYGSPFDEK